MKHSGSCVELVSVWIIQQAPGDTPRQDREQGQGGAAGPVGKIPIVQGHSVRPHRAGLWPPRPGAPQFGRLALSVKDTWLPAGYRLRHPLISPDLWSFTQAGWGETYTAAWK